jgi:hypothetical protein
MPPFRESGCIDKIVVESLLSLHMLMVVFCVMVVFCAEKFFYFVFAFFFQNCCVACIFYFFFCRSLVFCNLSNTLLT